MLNLQRLRYRLSSTSAKFRLGWRLASFGKPEKWHGISRETGSCGHGLPDAFTLGIMAKAIPPWFSVQTRIAPNSKYGFLDAPGSEPSR